MSYIGGSGWFRVLTNAGYEACLAAGERRTLTKDEKAFVLIVRKDGETVAEVHEKGRGLTAMAKEAAESLGLYMKHEAPAGLEVTKSDSPLDDTVYRHGSFGVAVLNRYSGGGKLFGSPIETMGGISLSVRGASVAHSGSLGTERVYGDGSTLLELRMSHTQFAELITSFGQGDGVPVTVEFDGTNHHETVEMESYESRTRAVFERKMQEAVARCVGLVRDAEQLFGATGPVKAGDKAPLLDTLRGVLRTLKDSAPWLLRVYDDHMDVKNTHAKSEFAHFARQYAASLQLQAGAHGALPAAFIADTDEDVPNEP